MGVARERSECLWCDEPVGESEQHPLFSSPIHWECAIRSIAGSVAHQEQRCSCYVKGSEEEDPPGMSKRQGAKVAMDLWNVLNRRRGNASTN
jgi:hypothetical protein